MLSTTETIETKSFRLAIYKKGDMGSKNLAILLPGRMDTKDYAHMRGHVDFLASKGYLALSFDPPGSWESNGGTELYTTSNYLQAVGEIIEFYGNKPTVLIGHSRGGSMAIIAGTKFKEVDRFVCIMGKASYKDKKDEEWEKNGFRIHRRDTPQGYGEEFKEFRIPYSFVKDSNKYDSLEDLKECTKPKMFIAGKNDVLVDHKSVEELYDLSPEPKSFFLLDSDHDYRFHPLLIKKVNMLLEEFLEK